MKRKSVGKLAAAVAIALSLQINEASALNAATDLNSYTSSVAPTTTGNTTTITTNHNIDVYNWNAFNVGSNETANFAFTAAGQTAVNYVNPGMNPSQILGTIMGSGASGNVLLFNPNGVTIAGNANITNLNTFFASTSRFEGISGSKVLFSEADSTKALVVNDISFNNVNNAHFVAPGVIFKATNDVSTRDSFSIRGVGGGKYDVSTNSFSDETGIVAPVAGSDTVSINTGSNTISSNDITVKTAGAYDGYANIQINGNLEATTAFAGKDGSIYLVASNTSTAENAGAGIILNGKIGGESADVNISSTHYTDTNDAIIDVSGKADGGNINLIAGSEIQISGSYNATSEEGNGGNIRVSAPLLKQYSVNIDASGHTGGGEILLGGEYQGGKNLEKDIIPNSLINVLDEESIVKANCTGENGDGGTVIVWADERTGVFGTIEAKGGSISGNGGFVETSGLEGLAFNASVDTGGGMLLLDPKNIDIATGGGDPVGSCTFAIDPTLDYTVDPGAIVAVLVGGSDVTLQANNDITVVNDINNSGDNHVLTLQAGRDIVINAGVTITTDGNVFLIANETAAAGVVVAQRDAGAAQVFMGSGSTINTGNSALSIQITAGDGRQSGDIVLADIVTNALTVSNLGTTAGSDITQLGSGNGLDVATTTSLTAGTNDINLGYTSNDFTGAVSVVSGNDVNLGDANALVMGASTISGNLSIDSGGAITQTGALDVTGTTSLDATGNDITLTTAGNDFTGAVSVVSGDDVSITDSTATVMGASTISGNFVLDSGGAITQTGALDVTGTTSLDATGNNITLTTATNDFTGAITVVSGNDVSITDSTATVMGASTISGNFVLDSGGAITQTGALDVNGTTSLDATGNDITLDWGANDFTGAVSIVSANDVLIEDVNAIVMGASTIGGNFVLVSNGAITQSGALAVTGITSLDSTGNNITLTTAANDFTGAVSVVSGNNVSITDATALVMGTSTISGNFVLDSGGAITQTGALAVTGTTSLDASGNDITLTTATNDFTGAVSVVSGNDISITDANALVMGASTISGNLVLDSGGAITQTGALAVTGTTSLDATGNDITLTTATNAFTGAVSVVSGDDVSITNNTATVMGTSTIGGNFILVSNGAITQSGALDITGTTSLTAGGANNITLDNAANDFTGVVTVVSANDVTLRDASAIEIGATTINGDFSLTALGAITLNSITADNILVLNEGTSAGSDIILNPGTTLTTSGANNPLVLSTANGTFTNNSGAAALVAPGDRWLIYTDNPTNTTLNGLTPVGYIYNATYLTYPPATVPAGNYVLFSVGAPVTPSGGGKGGGAGTAVAIAIPTGIGAIALPAIYAYNNMLLASKPTLRQYPPGYHITGAAASRPQAILNGQRYIIHYDENGNINYLEPVPAR